MKNMNKKASIATNLAVLGLIIALLVAIIGYNFKPGNEQKDSMSVSGNSELSVSPDEAQIYLNVLTDANTAKETQSQNRDTTANVMAALKIAGITADNIETTGYNLYKKTKWNSTTQDYVETGYELTNTIKITTSDISNVGSLVDVAVNAGANGVDHVSFTLTKDAERKAKADALLKATVAARDKAENLATTLDIRLGKVLTVQESNFYYTPYDYYNQGLVNYKADYGNSVTGNTISPQKVDVRSTVSITYQLN